MDSTALALAALIIGGGLRLFLAAAFYGNYDQWSYEIVTTIVQRRDNIYAETDRYNYSPLWAYCLLVLSKITQITGLDFHLVVRGALTLVDLLDAALVGLIAARVWGWSARRGFSLYLLNPVAILLVGYHGQFENLAALPLLLALYLYIQRPEAPPTKRIWALGSLAIIVKHNVVFSVWMLFVYTCRMRKHALWLFALSALLFFATFVPFVQTGWHGIVRNVLLYRSQESIYGMGLLLPGYGSMLIFMASMLALPFVAKYRLKLPAAQGVVLSTVAFVALAPGISEQYFILPALFGTILAGGPYAVFTITATVFLLGSPNNVHLPLVPSLWNTVWLAALGWLLSYFVTWKSPS